MATGVMLSKAGGVQQCRSDYRIVLLGHRGCGKSSVGSSILGPDYDAKPGQTLQCVQTEGTVLGRAVTLVEAPGWWKNYLVKDTPELVCREIEVSAALSPPGPHAFLLVVQLDSPFTEKHRQATEEHVGLLGEGVWNHTIVLFTYTDQLEDNVIERHIGTDREAQHHCLVERCQRRCHVFNVDKKGDHPQVAELLEKIDGVIEGNNGRHYEGEGKRWRELAERRAIKAVRGEERMAWQQEQRLEQDERKQEEVGNGQRPRLTKLRVVLLGCRRAGKSSAGNTILGQCCFGLRRTTQCSRRRGKVAQRQVTVVDTPGWWRGVSAADTPELTKQEVALGTSLCHPGPHALLLVHRLDFSFGHEQLKAWEEHLELLFGDGAWAYSLLLFTHGDWLGDGASVEQYLEAEGQALQRLVAKCGGRYHVLNNNYNTNPDSGPQVVELLEKVEDMAMGTGRYYELDLSGVRVRSLEKQKQAVIKRAARREKQLRQSNMLKLIKGQTLQLSTLRIALVGYSQSGKSSAGNTLLGTEAFDMKSTALCVRRNGEVAGQWFTVIDTPGWQKGAAIVGTPACIRQELPYAVSLCLPGPHALLLVVRADASFGEEDWRAMQEHLELLSGHTHWWTHTLVLFTCADWLGRDTSIEQHIESEGEPLRELLDRCGNRYHALDNKTQSSAAKRAQVSALVEKVKGMVLLNGGCHLDTGNSFPEGQETTTPAEVLWLADFQEDFSDEDRSDDVFLDAPSTERRPLLALSQSLTPIPSAEHSLASSATSITELVKNPEGGGGIKFHKFLHLRADRQKMSDV